MRAWLTTLVQRPGIWALACMLALGPLATAVAAPAGASATGSGAVAGDILLVLAVAFGMLVLAFLINAVFIHLAAGMVGLRGTFGTAFKASVLTFLLAIVLGILGAVLSLFLSPAGSGVLNMVLWVLGGTWAIQSAYSAGFGKALLTFFISLVVTIAIMAALWFFLIAGLVGTAALS